MRFIVMSVEKYSMMKNNTLIYVAGPTCVGKTKFSIELAKSLKLRFSLAIRDNFTMKFQLELLLVKRALSN